jgi:pimeloyl-ACP methyl ester carboxylesterase
MAKTKLAKTLKFAGIFFMLLITTKISANESSLNTGEEFELLKYKTLYYKILKPINIEANKKYPVVICLHGAAQMDNDTTQFSPTTYGKQLALPQVRLDYPAFIIVPKTSKLWDLNDLSMLKDIIAGLPTVDMSRIYVVGHSAGGQGTYLFIETEPQYFAAAIACSAYGNRVKNRQGLINFNLWSMHGDADNTVPYDKDYSLFVDMKALKARMKFTTYFGFTHGKSDEYIFGINGIDSAITPLNADQYKTEFAGPDSDPETNTLKWMFSKSLDAVTSVDKVKNDKAQPVIYPNPTNSIVNLNTTTPIDEIVVYNLCGTIQMKLSNPTGKSIDMSQLQNGIYLFRISFDKHVIVQKVVKE